MNMRKILPVILIATLLSVLLISGVVYAYMFRQTNSITNQFTPAQVSCQVLEQFDGQKKTGIRVQNTGNIDAYLRVRLVSYWVNEEGQVIAKASVMPAFTLAAGWIEGANHTYYYQSPVAPNASTDNLLSTDAVLEEDGDGNKQVLEVFAEAIQHVPQKAVTDSWGVTLGASGNITDAP